MTVDTQLFKSGMRRLAASVAVVTTRSPEVGRHGITATAVCSVSAEPPTLLCCINRNSSARATFMGSGTFAVNVLAAGDQAIADRFARPLQPEERFALGRWTDGIGGTPLLEDAIAIFECRRSMAIDVGSHTVFFGEVEHVLVRGEDAMPLLYAHGGYGEFTCARMGRVPDMMWIPDWRTEL